MYEMREGNGRHTVIFVRRFGLQDGGRTRHRSRVPAGVARPGRHGPLFILRLSTASTTAVDALPRDSRVCSNYALLLTITYRSTYTNLRTDWLLSKPR